MPIVAPQYGITPDRKKGRETQEFIPAQSEAKIQQEPQPKRPHFWYPKDLPIPEDPQILAPASSADKAAARHVTVEVRKRRIIPK